MITLADIEAKQAELQSMIAKFKAQNRQTLSVTDDLDAVRIHVGDTCGVVFDKETLTLYINKPVLELGKTSSGCYVFRVGGKSD